MIDWMKVQPRLGALADGKAGRQTYGLLLATAAGRKVDGVIEKMAQWLAKYAEAYGMTTPPRLAEFIAQICNETGGFRVFEEDLRYSAAALARTWPSRYSATGKKDGPPNARAKALAYRPEAIANDTYGLRMGNKPAALDNDSHPDGWQYRGRGALQLTFKANYDAFGKAVGLDLIGFPDLASDPGVSVLIALEFFKRGKVNAAVDRGDFAEARRITNGGSIGLAHVAQLRAPLIDILS